MTSEYVDSMYGAGRRAGLIEGYAKAEKESRIRIAGLKFELAIARAELARLKTMSQHPMANILGEKHKGMKISAEGVLGRIRDGKYYKELQFGCGEMLRHLEEMAKRFYAGDVKVVDEFLQCYCLDDDRPDTPQSQPESPLARTIQALMQLEGGCTQHPPKENE